MKAYKSHLLTVSTIALTLCSPLQASDKNIEEIKENKGAHSSFSLQASNINHRGESSDANEKPSRKEANSVNPEKAKQDFEKLKQNFSGFISNIFPSSKNIEEKPKTDTSFTNNNRIILQPSNLLLEERKVKDNPKDGEGILLKTEKKNINSEKIPLFTNNLEDEIDRNQNILVNTDRKQSNNFLIDLNSNLNQKYSQDKDELSYETLKHELYKHFVTHKALLNSSKNKDIVVFLGKTGSGKSTLINYLSGKKLIVKNEDVVLENPADLEAMEIGAGFDSQTTHPKSIQHDDLLFYDFPGFEDTRGLSVDLLTLNFVNSLLEKAKTVRLVFVAGEGEIEDVRGESLKKVIKIADDLIEEGIMKDLSSLVITKCNVSKTVEALGPRIKKKCGNHDILEEWINNGRLAQMSYPQEERIREDEREKILNTIKKAIPMKIKNIKGAVLLKNVAPYRIREVFEQARNVHEKESENRVAEVISPIKMNEMRDWEKMRWNIMKLYHTQVFTNDSVIKFLKDTNITNDIDYELAQVVFNYNYDLKCNEIDRKETQEELKSLKRQQEKILQTLERERPRDSCQIF